MSRIFGARIVAGAMVLGAAAMTVFALERQAASSPEPIRVLAVGKDFSWRFVYAGGDGQFGSADDFVSMRELRVPTGRKIELELTSEDYIYVLRAPELSLNQVAVPQMKFRLEIESLALGRTHLEIDPLCGYIFAHAEESMGELIVLSEVEYGNWRRGVTSLVSQ